MGVFKKVIASYMCANLLCTYCNHFLRYKQKNRTLAITESVWILLTHAITFKWCDIKSIIPGTQAGFFTTSQTTTGFLQNENKNTLQIDLLQYHPIFHLPNLLYTQINQLAWFVTRLAAFPGLVWVPRLLPGACSSLQIQFCGRNLDAVSNILSENWCAVSRTTHFGYRPSFFFRWKIMSDIVKEHCCLVVLCIFLHDSPTALRLWWPQTRLALGKFSK